MRFTDTYKLGSVVAGETLDPLEDSRRFLVIDRQLLGLFQVFGNGIITGWELASAGNLAVSVSPGRGHIAFLSAATTDVRIVSNLSPNSINYIYAIGLESTRFDRDVEFISNTILFQNRIILGAVTTGDSGVTGIDTSLRVDISFIEQIKALINAHRHRGGGDNPSKIDLETEVMGQLPGFHIEGIDANKVTSGIISPARLPLLEHSDLLHSGVLTHAQLDSFVRNLSNTNARLLGELSSVNLLQLYLAMKHIWNEVDSFTTNLLVMIPGITPDSFTDFAHSTAVIDKTNHLIQGVPAIGGQLLTSTFRTVQDFQTSRVRSNLEIGEDESGAFFKLTKPLTELIVESFDNVFSDNALFEDWTVETLASESTTSFKSDSSKKVDGPFSAKLNVDQQIRVQVTKTFDETQDWTPFNELEIWIETLSAGHGKIIFQTLKKSGTGTTLEEIDSFTLLDTSETTVGFRKTIRDITNLTRDKIDAIRIYTDTALGWDLSSFITNIDAIKLNNNLFFNPSGRIRFRLKTPQKAQWAAISWIGETNGGSIQARARTASSYEVFDQSSSSTFSSFVSESGAEPDVSDNRAIEVEIAIASSAGKSSSPVVRSVTVSYITSSTNSGLTIDSTEDFLRAAKLENAEVLDPGDVLIEGRIDVGDVVYGIQHSLQQASLSDTGATTTFATPIVGIDGTNLPLSPFQASQPNVGFRTTSMNGVASVERLQDRSYLAADTLNDRIVLFDRDGNVLKAFASNNVRNIDELYPLASSYNRDNEILYIAWSTNVSLASLDLSKITILGAGLSITLSNSTDKVSRIAGPKTQDATSNVAAIILSKVHSGQLETFFQDASITDQRIFLSVQPDAAKEGVDTDNTNFASLLGRRGLPIFVGNLTFIQGLFRPISISRTTTENWLVGNAKPLLTDQNKDIITGVPVSEITSVIEIDPLTGQIVFSDNSVDFSLVTLGGAVELSDQYIAVGGIVEGKGPPVVAPTTNLLISLGGGVIQQQLQGANPAVDADPAGAGAGAVVSSTSDFDVLGERRGIVKIVEKRSGRVIFEQETSDGTFAADIQVDEDENLVIVEKTFGEGTSSGRIIKLDEDGNVFFQFGLAELSAPNDVRVLSTGNLLVSS